MAARVYHINFHHPSASKIPSHLSSARLGRSPSSDGFPMVFSGRKMPIFRWFPTHQIPISSLYGIFTNICPIYDPNVGKYSIHGSYGIWIQPGGDHGTVAMLALGESDLLLARWRRPSPKALVLRCNWRCVP